MLSKITLLCYLKHKSKAVYQGESGTMAASDKMHSSETRKQLISSAKAEFTDKGFAKASLRSICKKPVLQQVHCIFSLRIRMNCFVR